MVNRRSIAVFLLSFAGAPSLWADTIAVDCTANPAAFDDLFPTAVALVNDQGLPVTVYVSGNCVSTAFQEITAAGTIALIGTGSTSTSIQINSGDALLKVFPASGSVALSVKGLTLTGAHVNGAIMAQNTSISIDDVVFSQNDGGFGGGIEGSSISLTVRRSRFSNNNSTTEGGAIAVGGSSGFVDVADTTFADNTSAAGGGGAIYVTGSIDLRVAASLFRNNVTSGDGGALIGSAGVVNTADVRNATFTGNTGAQGGAIAIENGSALTIANATVSGNSASTAGTALYLATDAVTLYDTLLAGTCAGTGAAPEGTGNIESPGNTCALPVGNRVNEPAGNLLLGALGDNGGPTQTLMPAAGSVLIDNGSVPCEPIDQRHFLRNVGACDVGAVEYGAVTPDEVFADGFD